MSNKLNGKQFVIGAVVGGVLGAITGLLLAPKPGRELREDIADQYGKISDKTVEIAGVVGNRTNEIAGVVSARTQEIAKVVGEHTGEFVGKAKEVAGTVANEVKTWKESRKETAAVASLSEPVKLEVVQAAAESESK